MMAYRKTSYRFFAVVMLACFLCCFQFGSGQDIKTAVDKKQILIGEQIRYDLNINRPTGSYAITFSIPDSIPHFEIIQKNSRDTVNKNGSYSFHQAIILTSFDSGSWYIPSFPITIASNKDSTKLFTDSVLIDVGYSPADSTGQLRDIKPVIDVTVTDYFWYYIAGGILLAFIIGILLYWYFRKRKKKPPVVFDSTLSPYDEALAELKLLEKYNLTIPEEVKQFHTRLSEIFKRYYSRKQQKNLMNKTTGEVLAGLREYDSNTSFISALAESLRCGDAVKFAKFIPALSESERCAALVKQGIESIEKYQQIKNL